MISKRDIIVVNYKYKKNSEQLQFELKKLEKTRKFQQEELKCHFEKEIQSRLEKVKQIEFQIEQLHMLPLGSEIKGTRNPSDCECK